MLIRDLRQGVARRRDPRQDHRTRGVAGALKPGLTAARGLVGVDGELLIGPSARMRHLDTSSLPLRPRTMCLPYQTPTACAPECSGGGTMAAQMHERRDGSQIVSGADAW